MNVLRSRSEDGPYEQVNQEMILARGDSPGVSGFSCEDESAAGGANFYRLERVGMDGERELGEVVELSVGPATVRFLRGPRPRVLQ